MKKLIEKATSLLTTWKASRYDFGFEILSEQYKFTYRDRKIHLVAGKSVSTTPFFDQLKKSILKHGNFIAAQSCGSLPNSPIHDVERIRDEILLSDPDLVITVGGGSAIDAVKGSLVLVACGGSIEEYFGSGLVTQSVNATNRPLIPSMAIMTASASASHLTQYSNITNPLSNQKKLIIDPLIAPEKALFDYSVTKSMSPEFTKTGAWDGIGHLSEVYYGYPEQSPDFHKLEDAVLCGIELLLAGIIDFQQNSQSRFSREALGLGTDLGGYAIMTGSTSGPHLNSFSLVDIMDHGAAVGVLQPYYGYYFAHAIPEKIAKLCAIYENYGFAKKFSTKSDLGATYADALINFSKSINFPTKLSDIAGFNNAHIEKMLAGAKIPQLESKLKAMPVAMSASTVENLMRPIVMAAFTGDFKYMTKE